MDANLLLVAVLILVLLAVAGILHWRRHESHVLEKRFGPEYGHVVEQFGSRSKAEAELKARQKRVDELEIVPLSPADASRFAAHWKTLQERFVDSPQGALGEADILVRELMQKRGYPMGDFERRAADISVHHPQVVDHYRAAHAVARLDQGEPDTERLRQAVIHYRALFAELLETQPGPETESQLRRQS